MKIAVKLAFDEGGAVRLLNWLAKENARILVARPELPLLYDSGVIYRREQDETWCDFINMLAQGHEDCDGLSAARAGELMAKGHRALRPGDGGYEQAMQQKPARIKAEVWLKTRSPLEEPGLYHCLTRYQIAGRWHVDDPSARLGMNGSISEEIKARWTASLSGWAWRTA